jgi:hypothetical protein
MPPHSRAVCLNSVPGNQSGRYFTAEAQKNRIRQSAQQKLKKERKEKKKQTLTKWHYIDDKCTRNGGLDKCVQGFSGNFHQGVTSMWFGRISVNDL